MKRISIIAVALLSAASFATANPANRLSQLETKLGRLDNFFQTQCDEDALSQKCQRVQAGMIRINQEMDQVKSRLNQRLASSSKNRPSAQTDTVLTRQYDILEVRLQKVEASQSRLLATDDPNKDAKNLALETQATLLRSRLVALQTQINAAN